MHLTNELLHELETPGLSLNERALLCCQLAKQFERSSNYEAAEEGMKEVWQGLGARPTLEGLNDEAKAQVLLRVGSLTGWIGSANQIEGSQEMAKDLISESARAFENLGQRNKVGEARSELGLCYWREGAFDEARVTLQQALDEFEEADLEQRAIALLRWGIVERTSGRLNEALRVYNEAATLFDQVTDDLLIAQFHHAFANALKHLVESEKREDYADRAFMEYTAASYHFERAGHIRYQACVENNIGSLLGIIGKYEDAHEHLDQAQMIVTRLKDNVHLAQVDETRARVLLAEGRVVEAEKTVRAAVHTLEKGDELSLLAEALTTHGIALARLDHSDQSLAALQRAIDVAEQVGDFESAGVSALTIIELLGANLSDDEVSATIEHAGVLLEKTQEANTLRRLATAFRLLGTRAVSAAPDWERFSFKEAVRRYEARLIRLALKETGGKVTAGARLLGFSHHQSLIALIDSRHKELLEMRSPVRARRHHLLEHPKRKRKQAQ